MGIVKKIWISLLSILAIAIFIFSCLLFRVIRVDKVEIVDACVYDWMEEIVRNEKEAPYFTDRMFIETGTTRNSIICSPMFQSECYLDFYGCAEIDGVKILIEENKIESSISPVFETNGKKRAILSWSRFAILNHWVQENIIHNLFNHNDSYGARDSKYYKYIDGSWCDSTWEDTYGEEMREDDERWAGEHIDTLDTSCAVPPGFIEKYTSLSEGNIGAFVSEWEQWSDQLRTHSKDTLLNRIITKIYRDYRANEAGDSCTFYAFDNYIEVRRYEGKSGEYPPLTVFPNRDDSWDMMMKASERYCYVPSTESNRGILYMTHEIDRLLSVYIGGYLSPTEEYEVNQDRLAFLRKYIQIERSHWYGWYINTMPIIYEIYLFDDGYAVYLRTSFSTGEIAFFPYDSSDKKVCDEWIE